MKMCKRILNFVQVINYKGDVRLCGWLRNSVIGSLSDQDMREIYHGTCAEQLREKLMHSDYSLCRVDACPYLAMNNIENNIIEVDEIPEYPQELYLAFENVCNYSCTCCNIQEMMAGGRKEGMEKKYEKVEERIREVLPHVKTISANGLGELFVSERTLKLLAEWKPIAADEEISVKLETNGSLFDEVHWKQIENLGKYNLWVAITVMSFEESTYRYLSGTKIPISQIENNLRFVKSLREKGIINHLQLATVVQESNFRMLPEFTRRCIEEFGADYVRLRPFEPWGKKAPEIEWFADIRNPQHPYYEEYKMVMKAPIFRHPKVFDWSGGRDTYNLIESPVRSGRMFRLGEKILADIILNMDRVVKKLKQKSCRIVIYGLGNIGKVLTKQFSEKGIEQVYILDRNKPCNPYSDVKVYSLSESKDLDKEVDVLITLIRDVEIIRNNLTKAGYNRKIMTVIELLENKNISEEYYQIANNE